MKGFALCMAKAFLGVCVVAGGIIVAGIVQEKIGK